MDRKYFVPAVLVALLSGPAFAAEHKGWVYDGLTGWSSVNDSGLSDNAFASNSNIGYRWGEFGIEVGHSFFGKFKDSSVVGGTTVDVDTKVDGWNAGINVNHDINEKWSVQGRIGVFDWNADGHAASGASSARFSDSGNDWYGGVSLDHKWRDSSSLGFGYTYFKANGANIHLWGLHTEHRFGSH